MEDHLARLLDVPDGSTVLDAGCGYGHVAIHLAWCHRLKMAGVDVVDRHLSRARENVQRAGLDNLLPPKISIIVMWADSQTSLWTLDTLWRRSSTPQTLRPLLKASSESSSRTAVLRCMNI